MCPALLKARPPLQVLREDGIRRKLQSSPGRDERQIQEKVKTVHHDAHRNQKADRETS